MPLECIVSHRVTPSVMKIACSSKSFTNPGTCTSRRKAQASFSCCLSLANCSSSTRRTQGWNKFMLKRMSNSLGLYELTCLQAFWMIRWLLSSGRFVLEASSLICFVAWSSDSSASSAVLSCCFFSSIASVVSAAPASASCDCFSSFSLLISLICSAAYLTNCIYLSLLFQEKNNGLMNILGIFFWGFSRVWTTWNFYLRLKENHHFWN